MGAVLAWSGLWEEPRIDGPRRGDPTLLLWRLMAAKSEKDVSGAQVAAKSPCRGAARRCAAARRARLVPRGAEGEWRQQAKPVPQNRSHRSRPVSSSRSGEQKSEIVIVAVQ